jgi:hypothetical protein
MFEFQKLATWFLWMVAVVGLAGVLVFVWSILRICFGGFCAVRDLAKGEPLEFPDPEMDVEMLEDRDQVPPP